MRLAERIGEQEVQRARAVESQLAAFLDDIGY
jgi:hypothetical protein